MSDLVPVNSDHANFADLVEQVLRTLSPSSARVYAGFYRGWLKYVDQEGLSPLHLWPAQVYAYLENLPVGKSTRQTHLHALRTAARLLFIATGDPAAERMHKALGMMRAPAPANPAPERLKRALNPRQVDRVLNVWTGETPLALRNRALIALMFLTGARRAELAALRWTDLDLEEATVTIRHGKGDKERVAAIAGEAALTALAEWRQFNDGEYVFPAAWKDGRMRADRPITTDGIYRIVRETERRAGVEFRPHDARRTHITEALATGTPLADVQAQAGHAQASTTLRYAQATNARERRNRLRLRFG